MKSTKMASLKTKVRGDISKIHCIPHFTKLKQSFLGRRD